MGIAPILAPSLGSLLLKVASWRVILVFGRVWYFKYRADPAVLHETLTDEFRNNRPMNDVLNQYWICSKIPSLIILRLAQGC